MMRELTGNRKWSKEAETEIEKKKKDENRKNRKREVQKIQNKSKR